MNFICIYIFNHTISFCMDLDPCITCSFSFQTCTYNRHLQDESMELPGVACLIPSMHGWHHHAQGMESMKHSNQQSGLEPHPYIPLHLYQESGSHLFHGLQFCLQQNFLFHPAATFAWAIFAVSSSSALRKVSFFISTLPSFTLR